MSRSRPPAPLPTAPVLALLGLLVVAATAAADDVILVPGSSLKPAGSNKISGTVTSESPTEVLVGTQRVPVEEIETIEYLGGPLALATIQENNGNLAKAADEYQKAAAANADKKPFVAQAAQFAYLRLLAQTRPAEAVKGLDAFVRANPKARQLGPALELLIRLLMEQKDYKRADVYANQLREISWAKDRGEVARARIQAHNGRAAEAVAALTKLAGAAPATSAKGREARLALAEALAAEKKYPEAEKAVREVVLAAGPEDSSAQAPAHNVLGDVLRQAGKPREALFAYLHTDLLFARNKDEHARALAAIVQLSRELKRNDRAAEALDRLRHEYPDSPWLASAGGK